MAKKLKTYEVLLKALSNFSAVNIDVSVFNKKGENVFKRLKETSSTAYTTPYLSFIEENNQPFTITAPKAMNMATGVKNARPWSNKMEYSIDAINWNIWSSEEIASSDDGKLYIRGTKNTYVRSISGSNLTGDINEVTKAPPGGFTITDGKKIHCVGSIETLLDYESVANNRPIEYGQYTFAALFSKCTSLVTPPDLPGNKLAKYSYANLFCACTSLEEPPKISARELDYACCKGMFSHCTSLKVAPELPARELAKECYSRMFYGCTSLEEAPELPATVLADYCYSSMFNKCATLKTAPELPAENLFAGCYKEMYASCALLENGPTALPAVDLPLRCYASMFSSCRALKKIPETLPGAILADDCYYFMFADCVALTTTVHCPASVKDDPNNLSSELTNSYKARITVVYDL